MSTGPLSVILATDCGSTTTKAILIEKRPEGYRQTWRGEAPTTVEAPFEDVTRGVLNSIEEVEELSARRILDAGKIITPARNGRGVDIYISTSSAGGGLQMLVAGAVKSMTAQSAQRAALGAGAIVTDVIATNDGRLPHEKIARIRELSPDMILLSGGTDGGTVSHVVELAEYIAAARPRPRLGHTFRLPVIFAGNRDARPYVQKALAEQTALTITENLRPTLETENLDPARAAIQELFLEHVMAHAPGYDKLIEWTGAPIMPTPAAVGRIMQTIAARRGINLVGVDIGGATTDVFSVFDGQFTRTVSANLGMSYSVSNVLAEAGPESVLRWMPIPFDEGDLKNRVKNKMIRPTTIPQTVPELMMEHALSRCALSLAFKQHLELATGLRGVQRAREIGEALDAGPRESFIDMARLDLLVGSGGVLSHAPRRAQAMLMLMDAFEPVGVTELAVDSIFMMPHLGVLSEVHEEAAVQVFDRDCMVPLGTCVAASGAGRLGRKCLSYRVKPPRAETLEGELAWGDLLLVRADVDEFCEVDVKPVRGVDVGEGLSRPLSRKCRGGQVGVALDARGRPILFPSDQAERRRIVSRWLDAMDLYPSKGSGGT
jgi:uncharacterized protein (TIGR01319 family)